MELSNQIKKCPYGVPEKKVMKVLNNIVVNKYWQNLKLIK